MEHTQIIGFDAMLEPLVAALERVAASLEKNEKHNDEVERILGGVYEELSHIDYRLTGIAAG